MTLNSNTKPVARSSTLGANILGLGILLATMSKNPIAMTLAEIAKDPEVQAQLLAMGGIIINSALRFKTSKKLKGIL